MSVVLGLAVTVVAVACGGGGHPQECKDLVACGDKIGGTVKDTTNSTYGENGSCFAAGSSVTQACADACKSTLTSYKSSYPDAGC